MKAVLATSAIGYRRNGQNAASARRRHLVDSRPGGMQVLCTVGRCDPGRLAPLRSSASRTQSGLTDPHWVPALNVRVKGRAISWKTLVRSSYGTLITGNHVGSCLVDHLLRQQAYAGVRLPCNESHEHTPACFVYGFHDLRRAFATLNAETLSADSLQALMRHKSYTTTQGYINMAKQLNRSVENLHVPDVLKRNRA